MKMKRKLTMALGALVLTASCALAEDAALVQPVQRVESVQQVEAITPAQPVTPTKQVAAPGARVTSREDTVIVTITGEPGLAIYADFGGDLRVNLAAGSVVTFSGLAAGNYDLEVDYHDPQQGTSAYRARVAVAGKAVAQPPVQQITPPIGTNQNTGNKVPTVRQLGAVVRSGSDWIEVTVTAADGWPVYVAVGNDFMQTATVGQTVRFNSLPAGKYDIEVDYMQPVSGVSPFRSSANIAASYAKDISMSASGRENGIDVIVSDASVLPITVRVLQGGYEVARKSIPGGVGKAVFDGLGAGTYSVEVNYDPARAGTASRTQGNIVVTGAPQRPSLRVEPIAYNTQKVTAWTTPGVKVNLRIKAYDYGQTVTASDSGKLRYTLPRIYPNGTEVVFTVYYGDNDAQSYTQTILVGQGLHKTLKYGDSGDDVEEMTERLRDLGYMEDDVRRYSSEVREVVKLFQRLNGLEVDGIAGVKTLEKLYSASAVKYSASALPPSYSSGSSSSSSNSRPNYFPGVYEELSSGDDGDLVYALQRQLTGLGYAIKKVDGDYGSGTEQAVRHFQRINGIEKTGVADVETQKLLYSSSAKRADSPDAADYKELSYSRDYHTATVVLEKRLVQLGYLNENADGEYRTSTKRAVSDFQERNGIKATGEADAKTQRVLFSSSARPASGYSGSSSSSSSSSSSWGSYRVLSRGSSGDDVRRLQQALLSKGYWQVRSADGQYGQWTYDAVSAFQEDNGLYVDGIAGKDTQNMLYGTNY